MDTEQAREKTLGVALTGLRKGDRMKGGMKKKKWRRDSESQLWQPATPPSFPPPPLPSSPRDFKDRGAGKENRAPSGVCQRRPPSAPGFRRRRPCLCARPSQRPPAACRLGRLPFPKSSGRTSGPLPSPLLLSSPSPPPLSCQQRPPRKSASIAPGDGAGQNILAP